MANIRTGRKSGFILRSGVMRRETSWVEVTPTTNSLAAASSAVVFTGFGATILGLRPFTIVRNRGILHARSDQTGALEFWSVAYGMAVVSDQALAIGITAVPLPNDDRSSDLFFVFEELAGTFLFVTGAGFHPTGGQTLRYDSKAMRKVEEGQDVAVTLQNSAISLGTTVTKAGRMLIKLH